ncbi:MAG: phosphoenolpyruvate carboxylase, partial [Planctomycetia bacterium]
MAAGFPGSHCPGIGHAPRPKPHSLAAGIQELAGLGRSAEEVQGWLDRLHVELVFTAHPSEAKRRSIRAKLRRMRRGLRELDRDDLLPRERAEQEAALRSELAVLWRTEFLRPTRPTVADEVERGLSIVPRLWEAVPRVHAALRTALARHYPGVPFRVPPFLTFGSWMGGDRDGNPFVTAEVTAATLLRLRKAAIDRHVEWCHRLHDLLTVSRTALPGGDALEERLAVLSADWPELATTLEPLAAHETCRRWIRMIRFRLERSRAADLDAPPVPSGYRSGDELEADVAALVVCLDGAGLAAEESPPRQWLDLVRTFGLHMSRLDVRQDARAYRGIMAEILAAAGLVPSADAARALDDRAFAAILADSLDGVGEIPAAGLGDLAADTLRLFAVLHRAAARFGPDCLGGAIVSLTRCPADVLAVLWLWRQARGRAAARGEPLADRDVAVVPLFEKIHDLDQAHETLAAILDAPRY